MKISTTYTVGGETFATEQEALDYSHFLDRRTKVIDLIAEYRWIFNDKKENEGVKSTSTYNNPFNQLDAVNRLATALINKPEVFRQALDIVEGK